MKIFNYKINPALALFLVAPAFGELFSGSSPLNEYINPVTFVTLSLLYGCGAIIIREFVVRWEKGWSSILLLGFAYGIFEEGVMVQSFFDPSWMDLGSLAVYGRVAGVNWVWAEHLTIYHALISIAASIAFVEAFYPQQRRESWVTTRKWWLANWAGLLGIYFIWEAFTRYDAGVWKWLAWLAVFGLITLARIVPARFIPPQAVSPPHPRRFFWTGFLGFFFQSYLVYSNADENKYPFIFIMFLILAFNLLVLWMVLRWSGNGAVWDDRHRVALASGALSFFLVLGPLTTQGQYPIMYFTSPLFILFLWVAYKKINARVLSEVSEA